MENHVIFHIGHLAINDAVVTTWIIMAVLAIFSILFTRRLQLQPGALQSALEGSVGTIENAVRAVLPEQVDKVLPFLASLWIFLVVANLSGVIPGVHAPTGHLSTTAALAILVFLSVHWFGIRSEGLKNYLGHYLRPTPLLLPFHIISEITRTVALAVRLFGNIMSLEMAAMLILLVAGFLAPVPILMLHIIEALVQAYIFGMLALIYIAGAMQSHQLQRQREKE
jgi:F-type H+-transporting ATPase subunit a